MVPHGTNHQWKVQAQLPKLTVVVPQGNQPLSWFQWISEWLNLQLKLGLGHHGILYLKAGNPITVSFKFNQGWRELTWWVTNGQPPDYPRFPSWCSQTWRHSLAFRMCFHCGKKRGKWQQRNSFLGVCLGAQMKADLRHPSGRFIAMLTVVYGRYTRYTSQEWIVYRSSMIISYPFHSFPEHYRLSIGLSE